MTIAKPNKFDSTDPIWLTEQTEAESAVALKLVRLLEQKSH